MNTATTTMDAPLVPIKDDTPTSSTMYDHAAKGGWNLDRLLRLVSDCSDQPLWRTRADVAAAYVDGKQFTPEQMAAAIAEGDEVRRLAEIVDVPVGPGLLGRVVDALGKLPLPPEPQPTEGVTYAHKIEKAEALIDWSKSAAELDRHIRAFNPFPGAQAVFGGQTVKVWKASPVDRQGESGTVLAVDRSGVVIACGDGALAVTELQKAGGKRLPVHQFLAGHLLQVGDRFDRPA